MNSTVCNSKLHSIDLRFPISVALAGGLAVRIYGDQRPSCMETSALQKGLVLTLDGRELIEEGMGFGVPIVMYADKTFFSSKADVSIQKSGHGYTLRKVFTLDTVSLKKFGQGIYINDRVYSPFRKTFQKLYIKHKKLNPFFNKLMELRELANIKTDFVTVRPRGTVTVTYHLQPTTINIQANFSNVALNKCCEVLVLNEQGSSMFEKYSDSSGLNLFGRKIGAWETVTANQAAMQSVNRKIFFSVQKVEGATLFRGWERTRKRFSWAGLSYSMGPTNGVFGYSIGLGFDTK